MPEEALYQYQYQESQTDKRKKIFLVLYIILIFIALIIGVAIRLQKVQQINNKPNANDKPQICVFCPKAEQDPWYTAIGDPSVVYCKTEDNKNIPIQNAKINYDYAEYEDTASTSYEGSRDTDPQGLATNGFYPWSVTADWMTKLTRTLDLTSVPDIIEIKDTDGTTKKYSTVNAKKNITNPGCPDYFLTPYKVGTVGGTCCKVDAENKMTCDAHCTLTLVEGKEKYWDSAPDEMKCSGGQTSVGYNPAAPFWAPFQSPTEVAEKDRNTDYYVNYKGPIMKFQLNTCSEVSACLGVDITPASSSYKVGDEIIFTANTDDANQNGPFKWYINDVLQTSEIKKTLSYEAKQNGSIKIAVAVESETKPANACIKNLTISDNPVGELNVVKTGPLCMERMSPNNVKPFKITITNSKNVDITVTKITDTLPQGFEYVASTASISLNGASANKIEPTINKVDGDTSFSESISWQNSSIGWILKPQDLIIITYNAKATTDSITGKNTNRVVIEIKDQTAIDNITYTFDLAQTCSPKTGINNSTILIIGISALVIGLLVLVFKQPTILGTKMFLKLDKAITDTHSDIKQNAYLKTRNKMDYKLELWIKKQSKKRK